MRVVVDTNILVSFAIRPSIEFETVFDHIAAHGTTLISDETLTELFSVMGRNKFRKYISYDQSLDYIEWYAGISEMVAVTERVVACHDPKDDKFLELAVNGHGDFIVTGDPHLLVMNPFRGILIMSPTAFLDVVSG